MGPASPPSRSLLPALLLSSLVHVLLLLLLSLIVLGSRGNSPAELIVSQSQESERVQTLLFELQPEPIFQEMTSDLPLMPLMSVTIPVPQRSPTKPFIEPSNGPASATQASDSSPVSVSKVALSIQQRVSSAGGKQGEVQFALAWKNVNDVDLHVIAPSGERISHLHRRSACHGLLDVDMNVRGESEEPVENVRWISGAPWGRYTVMVNLFRIHRPPQGSRVFRGSEFQLLAHLGSESTLEDDTVSRGQQLAVFRFQYVPQTLPTAERERLLHELKQLQVADEAAAAPLLKRATETKTPQLRDRLMNNIILQYPHTDAAIEAMRSLGGDITKS